MKKVFKFKKWREDPAVVMNLAEDGPSRDYIRAMKALDGRELKDFDGVTGFIDDYMIHVDWTEEAGETWKALLLISGAVAGFFLMAVGIYQLLWNLGCY